MSDGLYMLTAQSTFPVVRSNTILVFWHAVAHKLRAGIYVRSGMIYATGYATNYTEQYPCVRTVSNTNVDFGLTASEMMFTLQ